MPAALGHWGSFKFKVRGAVLPHPRFFILAGAVLIAAGAWGTVASAQAPAGHSTEPPLYPTVQSTVPVVDESTMTVAQIIEREPVAVKFQMLAYNGGAMSALEGPGPYTVFVPAGNYFDYLPRSAYVGLNHAQMGEMALHMVVKGEAIPLAQASSGSYLTLAGDEINFEPRDSDQSAAVGDSSGSGYVLRAYRASNGVVYITNKVLVPNDLLGALHL